MVYRLVNATYNVHELTLRLTRLVCQFIKASSASIYLLDPEKKKVVLIAVFNNEINMLLTKKKDIKKKVLKNEEKVAHGYPIWESHRMGVPLVADDAIGAIFLKRKDDEPAFDDFDKDLLSVVAEQSVTAIKNLQLYEEQQKIILGSIEFIGKLLKKQGSVSSVIKRTDYFNFIKLICEKLQMSQTEIDNLYYASILRNAGAIDVPYEILSKTSQLNDEEFEVIREQPARSVELIKPVAFLKPILPILLCHREKYDGTGYPSKLKKEQIPLGARIIAVVDAFEAMTRERPYKKRLSIDEAIVELKMHSGTQFDPKIVDIFVELSKQKKFRKYLRKASF